MFILFVAIILVNLIENPSFRPHIFWFMANNYKTLKNAPDGSYIRLVLFGAYVHRFTRTPLFFDDRVDDELGTNSRGIL